MSGMSDFPSSDGHGGRPQRDRGPSLNASPQSQRSTGTAYHLAANTTTPRGQRSHSQISLGRGSSVGKRSGTPAAEYMRFGHVDQQSPTPYSPERSFVDVGGSRGRRTRNILPPAGLSDDEYEYGYSDEEEEDDADFELHGSDEEAMMELGGPGFVGMENVRACCDGKHTVGGHHHHHHDHDQSNPVSPREGGGKGSLRPGDRPSSPAWSFRSRAGSTASSAGGKLFGGLKFGSKRDTGKKGSVAPSE